MRTESPSACRRYTRAPRLTSLISGLKPPVWREKPNLRSYAKVQFISTFGGWMQVAALNVSILQLTGSSASLAIAAVIGQLPRSIIAPLGGRFADRYPTRSIMLIASLALAMQAGTLGLLQATGGLQVREIYIFQGLASCFAGLNDPAESKLIPQLVLGKKHRKDALALNSAAQNLAWVASTPMAGIIIGVWGTAGTTWLFFGNALTYIYVAVFLFRLQAGREVPQPTQDGDAALARRGTVWEAVLCIVGTPVVWLLILVITVQALFNTNSNVLQPLIGMKLGGALGYTLISMSNGIGCLIGSVLLLRMKEQTLRGLIIRGILTSVFLVSYSRSLVLPLAMLFMAAGTVTAQMLITGTDTLLQDTVPLHQLGRVKGMQQCIRLGGVMLNNLCAGYVLVPAIGASDTGAAMSAVGLAVFIACWEIFRLLRRTGKLEKTVE